MASSQAPAAPAPLLAAPPSYYIGIMSGTSLDGVDGVLTTLPFTGAPPHAVSLPFPEPLRDELRALQAPCDNELHREALAANGVAAVYADVVAALLTAAGGLPRDAVVAVGAHGQTIRHQPHLGYTRQIINGAALAEVCGIDVVCDFRSRDVAAGGQGAPLVPAFHAAVFGSPTATRVVVNVGGIANISVLKPDGRIGGYDTGPGGVLLDGWVARHVPGAQYDKDGAWGASGRVIPALLDALLAEPYLHTPPPKSTGRDLFNLAWLDGQLAAFESSEAGKGLLPLAPADVQATLTALTARTIAEAIIAEAPEAEAVYVCGGGALNCHLMACLRGLLPPSVATVATTEALGVAVQHVEALAFAWLAARFVAREPGNLPAVTGASGPRVLGALYPA